VRRRLDQPRGEQEEEAEEPVEVDERAVARRIPPAVGIAVGQADPALGDVEPARDVRPQDVDPGEAVEEGDRQSDVADLLSDDQVLVRPLEEPVAVEIAEEALLHRVEVAEAEERGMVAEPLRDVRAFAEEAVDLVGREEQAPGEAQDRPAREQPEPERLVGLWDVVQQLADLPPVPDRRADVADADPLRDGTMAARGLDRLARRLPVPGDEGGVLAGTVRRGGEHRPGDGGMQARPSRRELRAVRDLLRERMLEGVLIRMTRGLDDEVRRAQRASASRSAGAGTPATLQQPFGEFRADHGGRLEDRLLELAGAIDARGEDALHGRGQRHRPGRRDRAVTAFLALETAGLGQRLDELLGEEGVPAGTLDDGLLQRRERRIRPEERVDELVNDAGVERTERHAAMVRTRRPGRAVLRAVVHEEDRPRPGHHVDDAGEERVALRIDPVEVVHVEDDGLGVARSAR
jgi:hypothetical protein